MRRGFGIAPLVGCVGLVSAVGATSCGGSIRVTSSDGGDAPGSTSPGASSSGSPSQASSSSGAGGSSGTSPPNGSSSGSAGTGSSSGVGFQTGSSSGSGSGGSTTDTVALLSGADWPWFPGGLDGADGGALGPAALVCVDDGVPANCPAGAIYEKPGDSSTSGWSASYPGAYWIWRGDVTSGGDGDLAFAVFQKTFLLGSNPTGQLQIAADDFDEVLVNGQVAGSSGSITDESVAWQNQNNLTTVDLTPYLAAGSNTITIVGQNGPGSYAGCSPCAYSSNTAGVIFGGSITSGGTGSVAQ